MARSLPPVTDTPVFVDERLPEVMVHATPTSKAGRSRSPLGLGSSRLGLSSRAAILRGVRMAAFGRKEPCWWNPRKWGGAAPRMGAASGYAGVVADSTMNLLRSYSSSKVMMSMPSTEFRNSSNERTFSAFTPVWVANWPVEPITMKALGL